MKLYTLIVFLFVFNFSEAQTSADSVLIKANNLLQIKETNQAILLLDATIKTIPNNLNKQSALQLLSKAYSKKGDDAKALSTLNEMMVLKDSLIKIETTQTLDALRAGYEADKQEKELALQKAKINQQQVIILAISICSLLSLGLVFLYFSRKKNALKNEMATAILKEKNNAAMAILAAEEKERKRIASDLHDGIGQMMSAVKMNLSSLAYKLTSLTPQEAALLEKTMALTDESCKEVRTVSHNMMPNALLKSGLSSAIKTFVDKIDHKKLKVNLHSEGLDNRLPDTVEIVLYRVIQETVNNVIKHAKANQLDIAIIKDVDGLSCTIEDNGIGFNFNDKNLTEGIGLKNIQARITYLQGTVEWDAIPNKGTLVSIHIPM
ncbi:MAG TPA: histidine kinase [Chitinophagaceae bacterium]|jgi:signal transduction histidine kinase|nr:histidine kinase [Chitinophagaceae bacterium]